MYYVAQVQNRRFFVQMHSVTITLEGTTELVNRAIAAKEALLAPVYTMVGERNLTGLVQKKPPGSLPLFGRDVEPADLCIMVEVAEAVTARRQVEHVASLLLRRFVEILNLVDGEAAVVVKTNHATDNLCAVRRAA